MNTINRVLIKNGFTENESYVYLSVLKYKNTTISQITRDTKIKRTTVYNTVQSLSLKGILSVFTKKNTQYISSISPLFLVEKLFENAQAAESILPKMIEIANTGGCIPKIEFFDGINGIKNCYKQITDNEILGFTDYESMPQEIFDIIYNDFIPLQRDNNVPSRFLISKNTKNIEIMKNDDKYFHNHRILPFLQQTKNIEFFITNRQYLILTSYSSDETFSIKIRSKAIFDILKNIFEACWLISNKLKN